MIDLHCHSHFSDGELSPPALLQKAVEANVRVLALTDHDTIEGLSSLQEAARGSTVKIVNGIELSTRWKKYDIHIIGLNINLSNDHLCTLIERQNEGRKERARQISKRLLVIGVQDAYEKASIIAGHERVGRPHFAQVLINEGLVFDVKSAFKRFLGQGKPAYIPTPWASIEEAVSIINAAEGQAVLAHPMKYALTRLKLHELISAYKAAGGDGMEVISGDSTVSESIESAGLCMRYELLASTGSDYHGDNLSRIALGQQRALPINCTPIWHKWTI